MSIPLVGRVESTVTGPLPGGLQDHSAPERCPSGVSGSHEIILEDGGWRGWCFVWGFPHCPSHAGSRPAPTPPAHVGPPSTLHLTPLITQHHPLQCRLGSLLPGSGSAECGSCWVGSWSGRTRSDSVVCSPRTAGPSGLGQPCVSAFHVLTHSLLRAGAWTPTRFAVTVRSCGWQTC